MHADSGAAPTFPRTCPGRDRKLRWPTLSAMFHTIFQQPDAQSVWAQIRNAVEFCQEEFPHVADYLEEALDQLLAFTQWSEIRVDEGVVEQPHFSD